MLGYIIKTKISKLKFKYALDSFIPYIPHISLLRKKTVIIAGAPGWLSQLGICLQFRS